MKVRIWREGVWLLVCYDPQLCKADRVYDPTGTVEANVKQLIGSALRAAGVDYEFEKSI